jgi:hypothetical protein
MNNLFTALTLFFIFWELYKSVSLSKEKINEMVVEIKEGFVVAPSATLMIVFIEFIYLIYACIGLFTNQYYYIIILVLLPFTKLKLKGKIGWIVDHLLSALLLLLVFLERINLFTLF